MTTDKVYCDPEVIFKRRLNLLLLDKDELTLFHNRIVAHASGLFASIRSAKNGSDALHFLCQASHGAMPYPDVILFDTDSPVTNGIEMRLPRERKLFNLVKAHPWNNNHITSIR